MKMFYGEVSHYVFFPSHFPLPPFLCCLLLVSNRDTKEKVTHYFTHHFSPQVCLSWKEPGMHSMKRLGAVLQLPSLCLSISAPPPTHRLFMAWVISMGTDGRLIGFGLLMGKLLTFCWQRKCWAAAASYCLSDNGKNTSSASQHSGSGLESAAGLSCP